MAIVREFGYTPPDTSAVSLISVPATIPVGHTLILAAVSVSNTSIPLDPSTTDNKGNLWTRIRHEPFVNGFNTQTSLVMCVIETELVIGDIITVSLAATSSRTAYAFLEVDEVLVNVSTDFQDQGLSLDVASGVLSTPNEGYVITAVGMHNAPRVPTGINGTTLETKYININSANGFRAVFIQHKPTSSATTQTQSVYDLSGVSSVVSGVFETVQAPANAAFEWDGSVETPLTGPYYWDGTTEQPLTVDFAP